MFFLRNIKRYLFSVIPHPHILRLSKMGFALRIILLDAVAPWLEKQDKKAAEIGKKDKLIDEMHKALIHKLYEKEKYQFSLEDFALLLFSARYLERIGDHIKSICEQVIFVETASRIEL